MMLHDQLLPCNSLRSSLSLSLSHHYHLHRSYVIKHLPLCLLASLVAFALLVDRRQLSRPQPSNNRIKQNPNPQPSLTVTSSSVAYSVMSAPSLIVGFHPDSATEPAVDLALALKVPFALVVCCVFPSLFKARRCDGRPVKTYEQFIEYLCRKDARVRREALAFTNASDKR